MTGLPTTAEPQTAASLSAQVVYLQAELVARQALVEQLTRERDQLRAAYEALRLELELLKRRLFIAKAERVDPEELKKEFGDKLAALDQLGAQLAQGEAETSAPPPAAGPALDKPGEQPAPGETAAPASPPDAGSRPAGDGPRPPRRKPTGRRALHAASLPKERIELTDPALEALCQSGQAERIGFEESYKLAWQRGGHRCLVIARVKYRVTQAETKPVELVTAPLPKETLPRSLAAPSLLAHIVVEKYCDGLPLFRIQDRFARDGFSIDRGTMCRWLEELGATCGATVLAAARTEALATSFCLATDATGVLVQPEPTGTRQPCRRGHYFVQIADQDHVFFEYTPKETSPAVSKLFHGFSGYVQADAKSVYDLLFVSPEERQKRRSAEEKDDPLDRAVRIEVGCWAHCRRKFWEAAITKDVVAREGLYRIRRFFQLEAEWRGRAPATILELRQQQLRPHMESFFTWAAQEYAKVQDERGLLRTALGYALRQQAALMRPLDDGRLVLDNNRSERALRAIGVGRKAWLFVGSDDHAAAAGHLLSLIATARLHRLDPESYLRDLFRVLAQWPRDRYLELAPKYWAATRARLEPGELLREVGPLTIPPPLAPAAPE